MHVQSMVTSKAKHNNLLNMADLIVTRKTSGSIIDQRPLFSNDGETLYSTWNHSLKAYSTQTGDFVREFESADHKIIGILLHPNMYNTIIGCTNKGELIFWNCQSGIISKKLSLTFPETCQSKVKTFHIVKYKTIKQTEVYYVLLTYIVKSLKKIYILLFNLEEGKCVKYIFLPIIDTEYYVDIIGNQGENLIALLHDTDLHILDPARNLADISHKTGKTGRMPTCIAGHPEDECVATGDSTGRVVVWKNLFQNRPATAVYHWHTLPVIEIAFSKSGDHMYTGGGECVLVKWTLGNSHDKSFLPRLPAPIKYLTIGPDNLYVAVSTLDNGIVVVNPQKQLTSVIQNFTWGMAMSSKDLFPAGLVVDPRTNSLVLNSRTGYIQFYNTHTNSLLYNIHVTSQNFLTQERSAVIVNTDVTKIAFNHDGTWMVTVEERNDKVSCIEGRMKFWMFDLSKQIFTLTTSIELPHEGGVNALKFQPNVLFSNVSPLVVTTGKDKKFKLWSFGESSLRRDASSWHCCSVGDYRNLSAMDVAFSMDGSLLGIGFGSSLTIWEPETCTLKCSLAHSQYPHEIIRIEFGKLAACNLVVVASTQHIAVWNILSLNITWSVFLNVAVFTADLKSTYMAAFTTDNTLYVFTPQSSVPVYIKKHIVENNSSVLGATFVPNMQENSDSFQPWQQKSQLYFVDIDQELLTLEPESKVNDVLPIFCTKKNVSAITSKTLVVSDVKVNENQNIPYLQESYNISKDKSYNVSIEEQLLRASVHTLPPMKMLCVPYILSLLGQSSSSNEERNSESIRNDNSNNEECDDEIEGKNVQQTKSDSLTITETDNEDELNVRLFDRQWTFLSVILPDFENVE